VKHFKFIEKIDWSRYFSLLIHTSPYGIFYLLKLAIAMKNPTFILKQEIFDNSFCVNMFTLSWLNICYYVWLKIWVYIQWNKSIRYSCSLFSN